MFYGYHLKAYLYSLLSTTMRILSTMANSEVKNITSRLLWWILGLAGALGLFGISLIHQRMTETEATISRNNTRIAVIEEKIRPLEGMVSLIRTEQLDRITKLSEQAAKLGTLEQELRTVLKQHERLLARFEELLARFGYPESPRR